jgi:hypothetical protein
MYPPDGSPNSLPRLRLRSMYAEKPEDNLLFQVSVPCLLRWKHLLRPIKGARSRVLSCRQGLHVQFTVRVSVSLMKRARLVSA